MRHKSSEKLLGLKYQKDMPSNCRLHQAKRKVERSSASKIISSVVYLVTVQIYGWSIRVNKQVCVF